MFHISFKSVHFRRSYSRTREGRFWPIKYLQYSPELRAKIIISHVHSFSSTEKQNVVNTCSDSSRNTIRFCRRGPYASRSLQTWFLTLDVPLNATHECTYSVRTVTEARGATPQRYGCCELCRRTLQRADSRSARGIPSRRGRVFTAVWLPVFLAISINLMLLGSPNLTKKCFTVSHGKSFLHIGIKRSKVKVTSHKTACVGRCTLMSAGLF